MNVSPVLDWAAVAGAEPTAPSALDADIDRAARGDDHVFIVGEGDLGPSVVAHLIHQRSRRFASPIFTLGCTGLPDTLLESELFGHLRGSFRGAYRDKPGLLDVAATGTLFLDDVAEMSACTQALLLRFLETGDVQPIGADRPHHGAGVRIIAAADGSLQSRMASGAFREDLYHRLNMVSLVLPPLRERREDLAVFLDFFLHAQDSAQRTPAQSTVATQLLAAGDSPRNISELKNVLDRLELLGHSHVDR